MFRHTLLLIVLLPTLAHAAEDWPRFRGPTGQGVTTSTGLPTTWSPETNVLWKVPVMQSNNPFSSPIVANGKVFLTFTVDKTREHSVHCFDAATGEALWKTVVEAGPWVLTDLRGGYTGPTPCTDGERVYALFGSCVLACLDFTGKILWRRELTDTAFDVAIGGSPVLHGDTLLVLADQNNKKSFLLALDKVTGNEKYKRPRPDVAFAHSTPTLITRNGKPLLLAAASNALQGIDPETGMVLWSAKQPGDVTSPVYSEKHDIVYTDSGRGSAGIGVNPEKGEIKWKLEKTVPEALSSPVIFEDVLYRLHSPEILRAIDLNDGRMLYSERLDKASNRASPIVTPDGTVYCASSGVSYVIKPGRTFDVLGKSDLRDPNHASPAVSDNRLYLRGQQFLWCVGKR